MKSKRCKVALVLGLVALLSVALLGIYHPKGSWRLNILRLKAVGGLPTLSWFTVLGGMAPQGPVVRLQPLTTGHVRLKDAAGDGPCAYLWETSIGDFWGRFTDERLLEALLLEQIVYKYYQNDIVSIGEGDLVIDAGGHLGTFTRLALKSGARKVVVFEPEPTNVLCLKRTFENEICEKRVVLIEAAARGETTNLRFQFLDADNSANGRIATEGEIEVPAVTIDETVADLGLDRVDFIKMDIEGGERHAVAGARQTIARFAPRMALSVYHRPDDPEVVSELVLSARPTYQMEDAEAYMYFYE